MTKVATSGFKASRFICKYCLLFDVTAPWGRCLRRTIGILIWHMLVSRSLKTCRLFLTKTTQASAMNNRWIRSAVTDSVTVVRDVTRCLEISTDFVTLTKNDPRWRPPFPGHSNHNSLNYGYYVIQTNHFLSLYAIFAIIRALQSASTDTGWQFFPKNVSSHSSLCRFFIGLVIFTFIFKKKSCKGRGASLM